MLSWQNELKHRFKDRKPIYYSYMTQIAVRFLSKCCCCCIRKYEAQEDSWYTRHKMSLQKFNIARDKLNGEVDMKNIITFLRISKLMQKMWLNRRQRLSVPYFRCYTIQDYQIY